MRTDLDFSLIDYNLTMLCSNKEKEDPLIGIQMSFKTPEHEYRMKFTRQQAIDLLHAIGLVFMQDTDFSKYENVVRMTKENEDEIGPPDIA